jgi:hypothetical protein
MISDESMSLGALPFIFNNYYTGKVHALKANFKPCVFD